MPKIISKTPKQIAISEPVPFLISPAGVTSVVRGTGGSEGMVMLKPPLSVIDDRERRDHESRERDDIPPHGLRAGLLPAEEIEALPIVCEVLRKRAVHRLL